MHHDYVKCTIDNGVALLTLNRPERMNAIGPEMGEALDRFFADLANDAEVRVIVLTGSGRAFCAGADMKVLDGLAESRGASMSSLPPGSPHSDYDRIAGAPPEYRSRYQAPAAISQPVVAAINGACAGIGVALAVACDVRIGSASASFSAGFPRRGLAAEAGLAYSLPAMVGFGVASDLLLSGRTMLAEEALRVGLLSQLVADEALLDTALNYAADIASNVSPRSSRVIKQQLRLGRSQTHAEALATAFEEMTASLSSADFAEGIAAFRERRPPRFPAPRS